MCVVVVLIHGEHTRNNAREGENHCIYLVRTTNLHTRTQIYKQNGAEPNDLLFVFLWTIISTTYTHTHANYRKFVSVCAHSDNYKTLHHLKYKLTVQILIIET